MKTFDDQLRAAIRDSGQSLNQLWKLSGVNAAQLSRYMRGERGIGSDAITKLCKALNLVLVPLLRKGNSPA